MVVNEQLKAAVDRALSKTFEDLAFYTVHAMPVSFDECTDVFAVKIPVAEPTPSLVTMICSSSLINNVVIELYGPSEEPYSDQVIRDTAGEIANTLGGQIIRNLNPQLGFILGLPSTEVIELPNEIPEEWLQYNIEENPVAILLDDGFAQIPASDEPPPVEDGFGAPTDGFGAPTDGFGAPTDGFGAPTDGFGATTDDGTS